MLVARRRVESGLYRGDCSATIMVSSGLSIKDPRRQFISEPFGPTAQLEEGEWTHGFPLRVSFENQFALLSYWNVTLKDV